MGKLSFVTGPVRSGKSRFALELARTWGQDVVFAATYRVWPEDAEMLERVRRHQEERHASWRTLEAPEDLGAALDALQPAPSGLLMDCLTLWIAGRMHESDDVIRLEWRKLLARFKAASHPVAIVGNEVGWSLVPEEPELRRFRDLAGWLAQDTAGAADEVHLCVAGLPLRLK
jgi:adenosyl cobinamide kinase/adenosyl cobinamide phosphate guanylyltransferase